MARLGHGRPIGDVQAFYVPSVGTDTNDYTTVLRSPVFSNTIRKLDTTSLLTTLGTAIVLSAVITVPLPFTNETKNPPVRQVALITDQRGSVSSSDFLLNNPIPLPFTNETKNPPVRRIGLAADQIGYIDSSEFWLFAQPFAIYDWSNPQRQRAVNQDQSPYNVNILSITFAPFTQTGWPNPLGPKRNEFGFTDASEYWMLDSTTPIKNNWDLPQRSKLRNEFGFIDTYKVSLFTIPAPPFYVTDWQNPNRPRSLIGDQIGYIDVSEYWMLDSTTPIKNNWELPQRPRGLTADQLGYSLATKHWLFAQPFAIYDWPNPQRQRSINLDQTPYNINLSITFAPFTQTGWLNPIGPKRNEFGFIDASEYWMLDSTNPIKNNWELPQRSKLRSEFGFTDSYKVNLFAIPAPPFYVTDWQNPSGPRSLIADQLGYVDASEYWMLNSTVPFDQPDWPNPQRPRSRSEYAGFTDAYKVNLFAVPPSPFYLTDWQNPRGPRSLIADQLGYIDASEYWLLNHILPITQDDWPNPVRAKFASVNYAGHLENYKINLFSLVFVPFKQIDWPNPPQVRIDRIHRSFAVQTEFWMLNSIIPFDQINWPNPVIAKPAIVGYSGQTTSYKLDLYQVFSPFAKSDWPNPILSKSRHFDHLSSYKINLYGVPFKQHYWPNPKGALFTLGHFGVFDQYKLSLNTIPGVSFPAPADLLLSSFGPLVTLYQVPHWRHVISVLGNVLVGNNISGQLNRNSISGSLSSRSISGNVDNKDNIQGDVDPSRSTKGE
jgi:hypothetical protein